MIRAMNDYRELPEGVAAAVATLIDAERRASEAAPSCRLCGHTETMRVEQAEHNLVIAMRKAYVAGMVNREVAA